MVPGTSFFPIPNALRSVSQKVFLYGSSAVVCRYPARILGVLEAYAIDLQFSVKHTNIMRKTYAHTRTHSLMCMHATWKHDAPLAPTVAG